VAAADEATTIHVPATVVAVEAEFDDEPSKITFDPGPDNEPTQLGGQFDIIPPKRQLNPRRIPTIRDASEQRPMPAAIQVTADGRARAVSPAGVAVARGGRPVQGEIVIPMGPVDSTYDGVISDDEDGLSVSAEEPIEEVQEVALELMEEDSILPGIAVPEPKSTAVVAVEAGRVEELLELAQRSMAKGDLKNASAAFSELLEYAPGHMAACIGRGRCHLDLGDYAAAMSDFKKAEDLDPNSPEPLVAMGDLYFARKDYSRAIELFDAAIELDGSHAMARCRRGISHYYKKNYRQAFNDLQRAYNLDPEIPNIRKYVQMAIKKLDQAGNR
jgi:Tfp pilus assembly protein PilF